MLGLMPRTGTNYLGRMLRTHRDCTTAKTLYEDFLLHSLPDLDDYVESIAMSWRKHWPCHGRLDELRGRLGGALMTFLEDDVRTPGKRPVFKTPSVRGIDRIEHYLPQADVVIVLRQGPATIESGMRSFGWDFESACRRWARAVNTVLAAAERRKEKGLRPFTLVRYEDLAGDSATVLEHVALQVGLDRSGFDRGRLKAFPVYGSSQQENVNWQPATKEADFNPLDRAAHWPAHAIRRFDHLSHGLSARLGYDLPSDRSGARFSAARQRLHDARGRLPWRLRRLLRYRL
ncbi:sulfotransferase [Pelagibius sp.]|uniref:sulfotransferase n=1 Tax=Pelagibius sp. TaxID=1931238 RepID=UPI003B507EDA